MLDKVWNICSKNSNESRAHRQKSWCFFQPARLFVVFVNGYGLYDQIYQHETWVYLTPLLMSCVLNSYLLCLIGAEILAICWNICSATQAKKVDAFLNRHFYLPYSCSSCANGLNEQIYQHAQYEESWLGYFDLLVFLPGVLEFRLDQQPFSSRKPGFRNGSVFLAPSQINCGQFHELRRIAKSWCFFYLHV